MASRPGRGQGYEDPGVDVRKVVIAGAVLFAACGVALVLSVMVFRLLNAREAKLQPPPSTLTARAGREEPPEPRLQTTPVDELRAQRAEEEAVLNGFGWIDRGAGVVRLPIERAIDLAAERGLPTWAAPAGAPGEGGAPGRSPAAGAAPSPSGKGARP